MLAHSSHFTLYSGSTIGPLLYVRSMSIGEILLIALFGFILVIFILLILQLMVMLIARTVGKQRPVPPTAADALTDPATSAVGTQTYQISEQRSAPGQSPEQVPASGSLGEVALHEVDPQTAALLMAIVAEQLETPLNQLRFISIEEAH